MLQLLIPSAWPQRTARMLTTRTNRFPPTIEDRLPDLARATLPLVLPEDVAVPPRLLRSPLKRTVSQQPRRAALLAFHHSLLLQLRQRLTPTVLQQLRRAPPTAPRQLLRPVLMDLLQVTAMARLLPAATQIMTMKRNRSPLTIALAAAAAAAAALAEAALAETTPLRQPLPPVTATALRPPTAPPPTKRPHSCRQLPLRRADTATPRQTCCPNTTNPRSNSACRTPTMCPAWSLSPPTTALPPPLFCCPPLPPPLSPPL